MTLLGNGMKLAEEAVSWLKTISTQLDTTNVLLQALVVGQQRTQQQLTLLSDIYINGREGVSAERVAAELARLQSKGIVPIRSATSYLTED